MRTGGARWPGEAVAWGRGGAEPQKPEGASVQLCRWCRHPDKLYASTPSPRQPAALMGDGCVRVWECGTATLGLWQEIDLKSYFSEVSSKSTIENGTAGRICTIST